MIDIKKDYTDIIEKYLDGLSSPQEFPDDYLSLYLQEKRDYSDELFYILDELFVFAHGYTEDEKLLKDDPAFNFNNDQLHDAAKNALQKIHDL